MKENLFLAKKTLVNNICSSARMENIDLTFAQTKTILDGIPVVGMDMEDLQKGLNLRDTQKFVLGHIECVAERVITYMLWAMRSQLFWDGNKRTSIIFANKILVENRKGVLMIPEIKLEESNGRLSIYGYISGFIYDKCLFGTEYSQIEA